MCLTASKYFCLALLCYIVTIDKINLIENYTNYKRKNKLL